MSCAVCSTQWELLCVQWKFFGTKCAEYSVQATVFSLQYAVCSVFITCSVYTVFCVKATVENPRGIVEKLFPKESVEGGNTVLRGSVRAPEKV